MHCNGFLICKLIFQSSIKAVLNIDASSVASNSNVGQPYAIVEIQSKHSYDMIQHQATETSGESSDNYNSPHIYAISSNIRKQGSTKSKEASWEELNACEFPPPVPEKMFDVVHDHNNDDANEAAENEDVAEDVAVGAAVAGLIAVPEIPYMTDAHQVDNGKTFIWLCTSYDPAEWFIVSFSPCCPKLTIIFLNVRCLDRM